MKRLDHLLLFATAQLLVHGLLFAQTGYVQFGNLNEGSVDVGSEWTELRTGAHTFSTSSNATTIEVYVNSRFGAAAIDGNGVRFQVRVDGGPPTFENEGSLKAIDPSDFSRSARSYISDSLSIFAVFQKLPAGSHTVSIWARAPRGHATTVSVDPGGWGGTIIVKQAFPPPGNTATITKSGGNTAAAAPAPTPQDSQALSAANAESQPPAPVGPRSLSEAEANLQKGQLSIWVPSCFVRGMATLPAYQRYHDYDWGGLKKAFEADFPNFDLRLQEFDLGEFIRLMHSSPPEVPFPDVAFLDNWGDLRPLLKENLVVRMWGQSRLQYRGWWVAFRQSQNFAAGESFLLWASQRPHWTPWTVRTNTIDAADAAVVQELSRRAVQDLARRDSESLGSILDADAARFEFLRPERVQPFLAPEPVTLLSTEPLLTLGNSRLAFVLMGAVGEGAWSFGMAHLGVILRKTEAGWKVWYLEADRPLPDLEDFFQSFDHLGLEEAGAQPLPRVALIPPADNTPPSPSTLPEMEWSTVDAPLATYVVESQYPNPYRNGGAVSWSPSTIELVSPLSVGPSIRKEAPRGAVGHPRRWRIWAISKAGIISTSDWRVIEPTGVAPNSNPARANPRAGATSNPGKQPGDDAVAMIEPACMEWVEAAERGQPMIAPHITIRYNPQARGARLKSAQSLTLVIASRRGIEFDTHRIPMTRAADGAWQAVFVPERNYIPGYAIFYFQDDKGAIDNHRGEYWDILNCHRGDPYSTSVAAQAWTYEGGLLAPGIQRAPNFARAVEILKEDLRQDPHDYMQYYLLWTEELRMGNENPAAYEQVGKEVDAFVAAYGDQYHALRQISSFVAYRQQKLPPGTVQRFRQAVMALSQNVVQTYRRAGIPSSPAENPRVPTGIQQQVSDMLADLDYWPITWEEGNPQKQAGDYLAFVNTIPQSSRTRDAYEGAFSCKLDTKDAPGAEGILEKLMALDRDRPEPLTQMARFYVEQKTKLDRAVRLLDSAETILKNQEAHYSPELFKSETGEINLLQGQAHLLMDDLPRARTDLEAAAQAAPDDPKTLLALGEVREKMGDKAGALEAYLRAASAPYEESSTPRDAYERLFVAQKLGTAQDAERKILELVALNSKRVASLYTPIAFNRPAPKFSLTDLDGRTFDNQAAAGKPTLLTFWTPG